MIDFKKEIKKKQLENVSNIPKEKDTKEFREKVEKYCEKYNEYYDDVVEEINKGGMFSNQFAKNPIKQNIHEKLIASYLESIAIIENFKNLSNDCGIYINNGEIVDYSYNNIKTVDYTFSMGKFDFYCTQKYTDNIGGGQGNAYTDVKIFLKNCNKKNDGNNYFLAIVDGDFYKYKLNELNTEFGSSRVIALHHYEVEAFLNSVIE